MTEKVKSTVSILGARWRICYCDLEDGIDGDCTFTDRLIRIRKNNYKEDPVEDLERTKRKTLRHEIIHAYLAESGIQYSYYRDAYNGHDETYVDWFAIQAPKIYKTFMETGCMED